MSQQIRECGTCLAIVKTGIERRCKNRVCIGDRCYMHLMYGERGSTSAQPSLQIKQSSVPGLGRGLFIGKRDFKVPRNTAPVIAEYKGQEKTGAQIDREYRGVGGQYVLCNTSGTRCWDAKKTNSGVAQYANDPRGTGKEKNAIFGNPKHSGGPPALRAVRKQSAYTIPKGTEVFVSYGRGYWKKPRP